MRVGYYQSNVAPGNGRVNLDRTAAALSGERFDLVVLTELFATGYGFADRAAAAAQAVSGVLYRVSPADPLAWGMALTLLLAVSAAANLLPARRAARIDPSVALRTE